MIVLAGSLTDREVGARIISGAAAGVIESVTPLGSGLVRVVIEGNDVPYAFFPQDVLDIDRPPAVAALLHANAEHTFHLLMGALASTPKGAR